MILCHVGGKKTNAVDHSMSTWALSPLFTNTQFGYWLSNSISIDCSSVSIHAYTHSLHSKLQEPVTCYQINNASLHSLGSKNNNVDPTSFVFFVFFFWHNLLCFRRSMFSLLPRQRFKSLNFCACLLGLVTYDQHWPNWEWKKRTWRNVI